MQFEPGAVLADRYRIEERLGCGGMGSVWRACDLRLQRPVAVKVAAPSPTSGGSLGQARRRLRREAAALVALCEPRIARVYDFVETGHDVCLVMELVRGESLAECLRRRTRLPAPEALDIAAQCAQALEAAHRRGIVHRDVKPSNIMLGADGVKMVDFGIASNSGSAHAETTQTLTSSLIGTPAYFAPERATGAPAGPASDFYSLGVVLYQLLAGHLPYQVDETLAMLHAHVTAPPDPLPADVPAPAEALCLRLLSKNPDLRPASAAQIVAVQDELAAMGTRGTGGRWAPRRRRLAAPLTALSSTAAALIAATAWFVVADSGHAGAAVPPANQGSSSAVITPPVNEAVDIVLPTAPSSSAKQPATPKAKPPAHAGGGPQKVKDAGDVRTKDHRHGYGHGHDH